MSGSLDVDIDPPVCTLTLSNPGKRNALSSSFLPEVGETLDSLAERTDVRCVVLTGAGDAAFCAGYDISELSTDQRDRERLVEDTTRTLREFPYPTVARLNGDTVGAGMNLAGACDLRVAVDEARFGVTPAKLGNVYSYDGIQQLVDIVGPADAKELLFTADLLSAERAERMGLVHYVVDRESLDDRVADLADTVGSNAPLSLSGMKRIVNAITERNRFDAAEREWAARIRTEARESHDHEEGKRAFAEKRRPEFEGR
ncbi:enoyl-CoA hydratase/isomerase family protein [Halorarius litoreus]|uniref:enoyl-CoA hydratase/isomerase family protein n=1 Tax=Halorarius litoreus TaxID=2962676 RepID=UPI0020CE6C53|nr:enoyl-CoA hydratase-related protein [Halorarius litoreus]